MKAAQDELMDVDRPAGAGEGASGSGSQEPQEMVRCWRFEFVGWLGGLEAGGGEGQAGLGWEAELHVQALYGWFRGRDPRARGLCKQLCKGRWKGGNCGRFLEAGAAMNCFSTSS